MSEEALITLTNVAKDYVGGGGVVHALREVNLVIDKGAFVAIVGTSGSGKSTLMNILGCLDRPTRGHYELSNIEVGARGNDARAIVRNRLIGFIFQGFNLLPRTTALENVELPLQYRGVPVRERRARAKEALAAVGLADRMDHTPNQLSGGQQQRVAIARALVSDPPLLLADEPTGNLDTRTSLEVLALLQRLNRDRGITIVLVTHEPDIAACASRVITFRDGRMVSDESPEKPLDAAHELAVLPLAELSNEEEAGHDEHAAKKHAAKSPIPILTYFAMALGLFVGLLVGYVYCATILGQTVPWVTLLFSVVIETWLGAWAARSRLGHPLSTDQRMRVALRFTTGLAVAAMAYFAFRPPALVHFNGARGTALITLAGTLALLAAALLQFLLLSLFSTGTKRRREART